jgi:hypothetical protein
MSLLEASNFRVTVRSNRPSVSVLYKPTRRRYIYTAVAVRRRAGRRELFLVSSSRGPLDGKLGRQSRDVGLQLGRCAVCVRPRVRQLTPKTRNVALQRLDMRA